MAREVQIEMKRKAFLNEFLGALGAEKIEYSHESSDSIRGTLFFDLNNLAEIQDFCWNIAEHDVPGEDVFLLAKLLNEENLLDIDMIKVERDELLRRYNKKYKTSLELNMFSRILEELQEIEVPMIDDGEETDSFFIHE